MAGGPADIIATGAGVPIPFRITAAERDGRWLARAERGSSDDVFGIECGGATEAEAVNRLTRWLAWQHEHARALVALQETERAYHRTLSGSAFAAPGEGTANVDRQAALHAVDAARQRLDEVRSSQPETS